MVGLSATLCASVVLAHEDHAPVIEELVVYGRAEQVIGVAKSASSGVVAFDDFHFGAPAARALEDVMITASNRRDSVVGSICW